MKSILIADDDFPIRDWLSKCCKEILNEGSAQIRTAGNGEAALQEFIENPSDILFVDIKMPVMDGLELAKKVRELGDSVYIVVLSSYDDFNYARTAFKNKVNEYILKTEITIDLLKAIIDRAENHLKHAGHSGIGAPIYSFDEFTEEVDAKESDKEKLELLKKYEIGVLKKPFFCFATYNKDKKYERMRIIQEENICKVFSLRVDTAEAMCFSVFGETSKLYQFQKTNAFMRKLAELNPKHVMCYGMVGNDGENVLTRISEVIKGLNYCYYSDDRIVFAENIKDSIRKFKNMDTSVIELYIRLTEEKDKRNYKVINKLVYEWFELLEKHRPLNIAMVKNMCQRIYDGLREGSGYFADSEYEMNGISKAGKISIIKDIILGSYAKNIDKMVGRKAESIAVQNALKYICTNYATISGLAEVAREAGLNPEYFSRVFKSEVGVNFSAYLNDYRLERAEELLRRSNKKLYEIAEETGFSSLSYFSRKFKAKFNKAPIEYRE